ncbi:EI24 domain-containing protein [Flammeovirga sp. MY04]|uniref:EI24 domain-containing protein n=1 Tax=Flammeovirga sp. MY04 TaxID=1191459 RepID=UPI000825D443|nr:EI24 domain-containing protein [Flammeovirga sp. MY04]ANQ49644.2 EI24 domain-containing protein [Flammeovirga sp. MY04]
MNTKLSYFKAASLSMKHYYNALVYINKNGLRKYYLYTSIFAIILFTLIFCASLYLGNTTIDAISNFNFMQEWKASITSLEPATIDSIMYWVLFLFVGLPIMITGIFVYPVILSAFTVPIQDTLTQKVLKISYHQEVDDRFDIKRMSSLFFKVSIPNALKSLCYSLILLPLTFIPVIGIVFMAISIAINSYYLGFGIMDNYFEYWNIDVDKSKQYIQRNKKMSTSIGLGGGLLAMIPILGGIIAPITSVVAGGLMMKELKVYEHFEEI